MAKYYTFAYEVNAHNFVTVMANSLKQAESYLTDGIWENTEDAVFLNDSLIYGTPSITFVRRDEEDLGYDFDATKWED